LTVSDPYIPPHLQPVERAGLEPGVPAFPAADAASLHSIAISLKRIADAAEQCLPALRAFVELANNPPQIHVPRLSSAELEESFNDRFGERRVIPIGEAVHKVMARVDSTPGVDVSEFATDAATYLGVRPPMPMPGAGPMQLEDPEGWN
jgi:hypothetical protein